MLGGVVVRSMVLDPVVPGYIKQDSESMAAAPLPLNLQLPLAGREVLERRTQSQHLGKCLKGD